MSKETEPGKHTLSGDGEPTMPERTQFRATIAIDKEDNLILVFEAGETVYMIKGESLFDFYAMLKRALEGDPQKRPGYLM